MENISQIRVIDPWIHIGQEIENPLILRQINKDFKSFVDRNSTELYRPIYEKILSIGGGNANCNMGLSYAGKVRRIFEYMKSLNKLYFLGPITLSDKAGSLVEIFRFHIDRLDLSLQEFRDKFHPTLNERTLELGHYDCCSFPPEIGNYEFNHIKILGLPHKILSEVLYKQKKIYVSDLLMQEFPCFHYIERLTFITCEVGMKMMHTIRMEF